jgi:hypothetical protein
VEGASGAHDTCSRCFGLERHLFCVERLTASGTQLECRQSITLIGGLFLEHGHLRYGDEAQGELEADSVAHIADMSERVVDEYLVECVSALVMSLVLNAPYILCLDVGVYCALLPRPRCLVGLFCAYVSYIWLVLHDYDWCPRCRWGVPHNILHLVVGVSGALLPLPTRPRCLLSRCCIYVHKCARSRWLQGRLSEFCGLPCRLLPGTLLTLLLRRCLGWSF